MVLLLDLRLALLMPVLPTTWALNGLLPESSGAALVKLDNHEYMETLGLLN